MSNLNPLLLIKGVFNNSVEPWRNIYMNAYGDGKTDDTVNIQNAINATPPGGELFVLAGNYLITKTLKITKNIILKGAGILICNIALSDRYEGINKGGNELVQQYSNFMLLINGNNIIIDGITFSNTNMFYGVGPIVAIGTNMEIKNCVFDKFANGIIIGELSMTSKLPMSDTISIADNKIINIIGDKSGSSIKWGDGICVFYSKHINIHNNIITGYTNKTPRNGINCGPEGAISNSSQYINIAHNDVSGDWDYHITTEGCNNVTISNNITNGKCITSIIERGSYITCTSNVVSIQSRTNTKPNGIQYYHVNYGLISNNIINGNGSYGIYMKEGGHNLIAGNNISGDFNTSINLITETNDLINSNITSSTNTGVSIYNCKDITCQCNKIEATNNYGVYVALSSDIECLNNSISNTSTGLFLGESCSNILFLNNILKNSVRTSYWFHPSGKDIKYLPIN